MMSHSVSRAGAAAVLAALVSAASLSAHHSFGVAFDATKTVTLTGVITEDCLDQSTHARLGGRKTANGQVVNWTLEGYPPNVLERTGWKKDVTIKLAIRSRFFGWRARVTDHRSRTFAKPRWPTGRSLFFGPPAGTGGRPGDG
jgi:hypothetical protein